MQFNVIFMIFLEVYGPFPFFSVIESVYDCKNTNHAGSKGQVFFGVVGGAPPLDPTDISTTLRVYLNIDTRLIITSYLNHLEYSTTDNKKKTKTSVVIVTTLLFTKQRYKTAGHLRISHILQCHGNWQ